MKNTGHQVETRTAFTLADALNQGAELRETFELGYVPYVHVAAVDGDGAFSEDQNDRINAALALVDAMVELTNLVDRVAESRITGIALLPEDSQRVNESVHERPFFVTLDSKTRVVGMTFSTQAALDNVLAKQVVQARAASERASNGLRHFIPEMLYTEMVHEAFAWHATHEEDVRRCARCATYFIARYRNRARFCSDVCRKIFLALANLDDGQMHCLLSDHHVPMQTYSGLIRDADRLIMAGYPYSRVATCAACVERQFPLWRNYVLPVLNIQERAAS